MSNNRHIFSRVAIHPSTNFPGRTQENILLQILRKKPEPDVENEMDEGRKVFTAMGGNAQVEEALDQKWNAASKFLLERVQRYTDEEDGDLFTAEEYDMGIENVRTGLRKSLVDDEDDEDDEDEDDEDGVATKVKDTEMSDRAPEAAEKPKGLPLAAIAKAATKAARTYRPDGISLLPHLKGEKGHDTVLAEYLGEGTISPLMMIRRGPWKYITCPTDPPQFFNLEQDPHELVNLAQFVEGGKRKLTAEEEEAYYKFVAEGKGLWDFDTITKNVLESQRKRRFVWSTLTQGRFDAWDFDPSKHENAISK